jgi:CubicO group peptidase (beta-lactamase class C family)
MRDNESMQDERREAPQRINRRNFVSLVAAATAAVSNPVFAKESKSGRTAGAWIPTRGFLDSLPGLMKLAVVPGLSLAVVERGAVVWARTFGVLNASTREPVREDSLFEAASMSKPVFAYGVLQLVEQGKLELDRPLVSYYKPPYLPNDPLIDQITARHALSHSSGLPNWGDDTQPDSLKPMFQPGKYLSYSGEGFFWLQLVVERLTGKGLDAFMRSQLFEPAGMTRSMFACDEEQLASLSFGHNSEGVANNHGLRGVMKFIAPRAKKWGKPVRDWAHEDWLRVATELQPNAPPKRVRFQNSASSLLTTARDYAKFVALVGEHASRAPWEISETMRRAMLTPQVAVQQGEPVSWGLGWELEQGESVRFSHEGNNENVFTSYAIGDPQRGRGLVILTNSGGGYGVLQRITRAATASDPLGFITNLNPPRGA